MTGRVCTNIVIALIYLLNSVSLAQQINNSELASLMKADQDARTALDAPGGPKNFDFAGMAREDAERRARVHALLDAGQVRTAEDYDSAALIYQHGSTPDDILFAHVLAMDAMAKGSANARWLAAATLDRYLIRLWQPQVFGTQSVRYIQEAEMHRDRMNQGLVSDSMRTALCVRPLADQKIGESTSIPHCDTVH